MSCHGTVDDSRRRWKVIRSHNWDSHAAIETTLCDAIDALGAASGDLTLYDHVDLEAVVDAISPGEDRGVEEVRFEYEEYEIRVERDGTIAARKRVDVAR